MEPRRVRATPMLVSRCVGADKATEVTWLRENVMGQDQKVWGLRITARDRYSDRCCGWGERLNIELDWPADRSGGRWNGKSTTDAFREGHADTLL